MNKTSLCIAALFSCCFLTISAQEAEWERDPTYSDNIRHKEIIMNTTPLIAQFVPFNASTLSNFNLFDFQIRRLKNGRGRRMGLGINLDANFNAPEPSSFYFRYGFVKVKQLSPHFHLSRSWDLNVFAEDINGNGTKGKVGFSGFGVSYSAGLEYSINRFLTISTEGTLFLGLIESNFGGAKFKFIPPVGLFLHVKL